MKVLSDTSVLVAGAIEEHHKNSESLLWLQRVKAEEIEGFISTDTLAELYATVKWFPLH